MNDSDPDDDFGRTLGSRLRQDSGRLSTPISAEETIRRAGRLRRTRRIIAGAIVAAVVAGFGGGAYGLVNVLDRADRGPIPISPASAVPSSAPVPKTTSSPTAEPSRTSTASGDTGTDSSPAGTAAADPVGPSQPPASATSTDGTPNGSGQQDGAGDSEPENGGTAGTGGAGGGTAGDTSETDTTGDEPVSVALQDVQRGDDPTVDTVRDHVWHQVGGGRSYLGDRSVHNGPYQGTFVAVGNGLFAATGPGDSADRGARVIGPDGEVVTTIGGQVRNVARGPAGSVMWIQSTPDEVLLLAQWTVSGELNEYRIAMPAAERDRARFVATSSAVFVEVDGSVTKYEINGTRLAAGEAVNDTGRLELISGDPVSNTLAVRGTGVPGQAAGDGRSCSTVLHADDELPWEWDTCNYFDDDYTIRAMSPDGQYLFATTSAPDGSVAGAVFRPDGAVLLRVTGLARPEAVFDDRDRLNLFGSGGTSGGESRSAVVVCDLDGGCRQATTPVGVRAGSGNEKIGLVGWVGQPR